jgi:lipid II:glycine glycyltransferase (peptidoglycan interpeptide bridge formation enzyme)
MNVRLANDQDKESWNDFLLTSRYGSFMQSWEWGEMQAGFGLPTWRLVVEEEENYLGVALVLQREVSFGRCWLYVPHGPVFNDSPKVWRLLNDKVREIGGGKRAIFLRADPLIEKSGGSDVLLAQSGWQKSEREVQPKHTLVVDLNKSEEDLMSEMHKKTRYNIRLARRKGVEVSFSGGGDDLEAFLQLTADVEGRGSFRYHPHRYYREMQKVLGPKGMLRCAVARSGREVLAVNLLVNFGKVITYTHGASSSSKREVMAPHLLQWESIRQARRDGYEKYDFFGVADNGSAADHPWAGITRFKMGFGGDRVDYMGAYDLVLDPAFYAIYNVARRMKGALR